MNKELFTHMQKQMSPAPEVRAELAEKLAQPVKKRPVPWVKYGAVAACAALVIGAFSVYRLSQDHYLVIKGVQQLHSYVTVEGLTGYVAENAAATENTTTGGGDTYTNGLAIRDYAPSGDQDMDMTPEDLASAMLDVGYTQDEVDKYQSIGYQMTWAKWWKFVGEQQNSEGDDPFNLDNLKTFSQKELYVNTGALPGGAYVGDVPVQEGAEHYQKLMDHFNGALPDWYGGAYLDQSGRLVVQLVESKDPGDKSLELQVLEWTGSDTVMFSSCKYSLNQLKELMDQLNALPAADPVCRDVMAGWGVDEEANRIELTLTQVNDHILSILAELDPEDDMILVQVGQRAVADVGTEDPAVHHVVPGGTTVPEDDENLIAVEPWYDGSDYSVENLPAQLPQSKQPALLDSVPEEDADTPSYSPDP